MTRRALTAERITELSLKLAMLSSQRVIGQADLQYRQLEQALRWHRWSCQSIQVARRLIHALFSRRLLNCLALIGEQRKMLQLAADEGSDDGPVLDSLVALGTALTQFELGPNPTPKHRLAYSACEVPAVRARFAHLVRMGNIESAPDGLKLLRATRRRVVTYATFGLVVAWQWMIFIAMAMNGALDGWELVGYLVGSVVLSGYLTRSLFIDVRADERAVQHLNSKLKPRPAAHRQPPH